MRPRRRRRASLSMAIHLLGRHAKTANAHSVAKRYLRFRPRDVQAKAHSMQNLTHSCLVNRKQSTFKKLNRVVVLSRNMIRKRSLDRLAVAALLRSNRSAERRKIFRRRTRGESREARSTSSRWRRCTPSRSRQSASREAARSSARVGWQGRLT